ncbi:MAG TPA: di-heme enzyme [Polyangiaceae bacterium]|nr:di-heme enzyme [Polyangiaceae bacterium]
MLSASLLGCDGDGPPASSDEPDPAAAQAQEQEVRELLGLPERFALPAIPEYNPISVEKIELGRHLFYDARLSANQSQSCSSCHLQRLAFSDGQRTPLGSTGQQLHRNSPGLANVAYLSTLTWANPSLRNLEDQLPVPILGDNPIELGVSDGARAEVLARFDDDRSYRALFKAAFPDSPSGATIDKIVFALASFCRTLLSTQSPYDRYAQGDATALSASQRRGLGLILGERMECFHCHAGTNLTVSYHDAKTTEETARYPFFNDGLYNLDGEGAYPPLDQGLYEVTFDPQDRGLFRPPSLRNIALTAPYMHDGSIPDLRGVLAHYSAGGSVTESGPLAGDGRTNPLKSGLIRGFKLSEQETEDVLAFFESLTDDEFVTNPAYSNPFESQ